MVFYHFISEVDCLKKSFISGHYWYYYYVVCKAGQLSERL